MITLELHQNFTTGLSDTICADLPSPRALDMVSLIKKCNYTHEVLMALHERRSGKGCVAAMQYFRGKIACFLKTTSFLLPSFNVGGALWLGEPTVRQNSPILF